MDINMLCDDILKSGLAALIISRVAKGIGQKDISEIISAAGWCVVGLDLALIFIPTITSISNFFNGIGAFFSKIDNFIESIPFIGLGGK